jgi:protein-disulfide isomerase
MKRSLPFVIIICVLALAVGIGWYLKRNALKSAAAIQSGTAVGQTERSPGTSSTGSTAGSQGSASGSAPAPASEPGADPPHSHGPKDAPVTLEEFGDFECPPCGLLHPVLQAVEREYGSRVRIIFREFPLVPTHQHALAAARAAEAAGMQGKFWEMHDLLYENQKTWHEAFDVRPIFEGYATRIGLDLQGFRTDSTSDLVEQRIFLDGKRGHALGVKGTPTVFLNGREVPFESLPLDKLRPLINAELPPSAK